MSEEYDVRLQKLQTLREKGVDPYPYEYPKTHDIETILETYRSTETDMVDVHTVKIAGRIVAKRGHGKATFGNILDETGAIQYYANVNKLGDESYAMLLNLDVGDIIGIEGKPFRTKRGELSVNVDQFCLLSKALNPLPEKFHGLQDKELRYRQRYVDLIANPEVREVFKTRSRILLLIRHYLSEIGFMEVETPVLHSIYGGAAAQPFVTHHNDLGQDLFLRIALELHLKRLLVGGFERIFEIGRVFRNEGVSYKHNPEYTLLELYQAYVNYETIMDLTESLIGFLVKTIHGQYEIEYQGTMLNFKPPFKRVTLNDALTEHAGVSIDSDIKTLQEKAKSLGLDISNKPQKGQLLNYIYDKAVEQHLVQPTFILDYPWETSPLAKRKKDAPHLVERFELIINSMEIANAFSELNDPIDQHDRFVDQKKAQASGDKEAHQMDDDFINSLKYGMPPAGGLGIGIDRIVMLLTDSASIRDVLFFPHMKKID